MPITKKTIEDDTFVTIVWLGDTAKDAIINPNGVTHDHETEIVQGVVEFRFDEKAIVVKAGEIINLPLNLGYDVLVLQAPTEGRCRYPKAVPGAVESIAHLIDPIGKVFPTFSEEQAKPQADVVLDSTDPESGIKPAPAPAPGRIASAWSAIKNFFTA